MFPAGAGMNLKLCLLKAQRLHVPRRRGDEPSTIKGLSDEDKCSPQARG